MEYIRELKKGSEKLENLSQEMRLFSRVLEMIANSFNDKALVEAAGAVYTGHEMRLSQQIREVLRDCETTMTDIEVLLGKRKPSKSIGGNIMGRALGLIKVDKVLGDVNIQKEKLSNYRATMGTLMQFMILYSIPRDMLT